MDVRLSNDRIYPMTITDSENRVVKIPCFTLENNDDWYDFIDELKGLRDFYLTRRRNL